jgi:hypothetical protein
MPGSALTNCLFRALRNGLLPMLWLVLAGAAYGAPPRTFSADYNASYEGISADASRQLVFDAATGRYSLHSKVELRLFGSSLTKIDERSDFLWVEERPLPQHYEFVQTGFGARSRTVDFDQANMTADFTVNEDKGQLMLNGPAFDDLSGYLVAKEQLAMGAIEVRYNVVDRGELREHYYKLVNRVVLDTPLGKIKAVHLVRIREDNARKTEIWLAPDHDYLLLKLVQTEPDGSSVELNIRAATLGDHVLSAATLEAAASAATVSPSAAPSP